ncbi:MAG: NADH-quinone oxidoreductase subunit C [Bacteroidia bacterium]|nr:NADH-quinone oxidoreductase subunit C [Bacteroidia bacterium]
MQTPVLDQFESLLQERFPTKVKSVEQLYDIVCATVTLDVLKDVMHFLKDSGYSFLTTLNAVHYPNQTEKFAMVYHLHDLQNNLRIRVKAYTTSDHPSFPTITDIFEAADWMERQEYDFFGIHFTGHKNLKRILNMDNLEGWPLRKEYPLEDQARFDKDDKMFGR